MMAGGVRGTKREGSEKAGAGARRRIEEGVQPRSEKAGAGARRRIRGRRRVGEGFPTTGTPFRKSRSDTRLLRPTVLHMLPRHGQCGSPRHGHKQYASPRLPLLLSSHRRDFDSLSTLHPWSNTLYRKAIMLLPVAASLLLVLAATSAAHHIPLPRPPPLRHQRPYNNLTNIHPPPLPSPTATESTYSSSSHAIVHSSTFVHHAPNNASSHLPTAAFTASPYSCTGATLNIASASLDYWYPDTYTQVDSTFVIQYDHNDSSTAWTLVPASETLNITSAVEAPSCTSMTAFNTALNSTMLEYSCWDTPTPIAAATTSVEQTAYIPVNQTTSHGSIPSVVVTPTPAALTIGSSSTVAQGTNVVHFSQVEIISKQPLPASNGTVRCVTTTAVHQLSEPLSFDYEESAHAVNAILVKGKIHAAVLRAVEEHAGVPLSSVSLGTFDAEPTVVVVVQRVLAAAVATPAGIVQSVLSLDTPTPTLPSGLSLVETTPTDTGIIWAPLTAHVESSDTELMLPTKAGPDRVSAVAPTTSRGPLVPVHFTAHIESSDLNLQIPQDPTATNSVVTAVFSGITLTATRVNNPTPGGGNDVGPILSAIISAAQPANTKPTNAAQVLSNAEQTFANPTVGAIASGIGGLARPAPPPSSGSGSGPIVQPGQNPVFSVGTSMVTATDVGGGAFVISGQTASAGGAPITVGGQEVSIAPGGTAIMVGGTAAQLSSPTSHPGALANIPLITVGSQVFTANAATQFNIGGSVLTPGGQVIVQGTTISLAPDATRVALNGVGSQLSPPAITPAPLLTVGGTVYQPNIGRTYNIGGQILAPGGAIVVSGTTISLPADGSNVVVNGLIQPIGAEGSNGEDMATITAPPVLSVDGTMISANGGTTYIVSGQTLTPGGAITFNGPHGLETISLNDEANQLVTIANGQTATSYVGMVGAASGGAPILTINGNTYTAIEYDSGSGATYVIDGQTLTIGGTITIGDETVSLLPGGTAIMIASAGGSTTSQIDGAYGVKPTAAPMLTIGGHTFTAINNGATYIIDGETLTPNDMETITIDGHTYVISLSPHATLLEIVEIGSHGQAIATIYETLFPATATASSRTVASFMHGGAAATVGASSSGTASPTNAEGSSPSSSASTTTLIPFTGAIAALGSLALAIWL
ncbi:hypothetical protein AC579_8962 [Pseudocercospora musae]|uniref:Uncharacterized protein n=1 Tax=Pseudocercospora musae TaxID=113226 RepID=A0A139I5S4_9PEZI|nr:hypothetical protein AC579_8962 [Pseudocercospora musae]